MALRCASRRPSCPHSRWPSPSWRASPIARSSARREAARAAAVARIDEEARLAAQSVRASLAQLEQAVDGGPAGPGRQRVERLSAPPPRSVPPRGLHAVRRAARARSSPSFSPRREPPRTACPRRSWRGSPSDRRLPVSGAAGPARGRGAPAGRRAARAARGPAVPREPAGARLRPARARPRVARLRSAPDAGGLPLAPGFRRRLSGAGSHRGLERAPSAGCCATSCRSRPLLEARGSRRARWRSCLRGRTPGRVPSRARSRSRTSRGFSLRVSPSAARHAAPGRPASACSGCRPPAGVAGLARPAARARPGGAGGRPRARVPGRRHPRAAHAAHHDPRAGRDAGGGPGRAARVRHARRRRRANGSRRSSSAC